MGDFEKKDVVALFGKIAVLEASIADLLKKIEDYQQSCDHPIKYWEKCNGSSYNGSSIGFPVECQKCLAIIELNRAKFCSKCFGKMKPDLEKGEEEKPKVVVGYVCSVCGHRHIGVA